LFRAPGRFRVPAMRGRSPTCAIRPIKERDIGACEAIYRLNEPARFPPGYFDLFFEKLRGDGSLVLIAEVDGQVRGVGGVRILRIPRIDAAMLGFGMVHPAHQKRGLGTVLLIARLATLPKPQLRWRVHLLTTGGSETFYQRFGFAFMQQWTDERGTPFGNYRTLLYSRDWDKCHALLNQWGVRLEAE
jgi:predicted N-acetyltransferase YhbS